VSVVAVTTVDLARIQFATTSLYHFLFVPLTLGLAPMVAVMQTRWYRSGDEAWLRLTRFFGTLMLINFAIGVATGLVQEFQFGMNWSIYSKFVGDVFGAPLAIEGLAAFMLEATFIGLWIFGWNRLSRGLHLATIWLVALGTWLSAYFILVANSWMQHPTGYVEKNGKAELASVWDLLTAKWAVWAFGHTMLAGLTVAACVVFGVSCWHLLRRRNQAIFMRAAKLALIFLVPVSMFNLAFGSEFGVLVTDQQPMKISAVEAQWDTCQPCGFSIFQIGGFSPDDQTPTVSIVIPHLLSILATNSWNGKVEGMTTLNKEQQKAYGRGQDYYPLVRTTYWAMRVMAYAGSAVVLVALIGAFLYRRRKLEDAHWFHWIGIGNIALPFIAALAGWVLTEAGRQPWIVYGLLRTADANSPAVTKWWLGTSLAVFALLYGTLAVVDFVHMRRYARIDPPEPDAEGGEGAVPVLGY
jgi:cytochrome d ubiquinol oxidase subunit I